jgi:hypothetical protein
MVAQPQGWVRVMGQRNAVDILGIGAQKSATSWAANLLAAHKNVWIPKEHAFSSKEVSFFDGRWDKGLAWYREIMTPPDPRMLSADVSPGYSRIELDRVRACYQLSPTARVFFLMRNPIDRDWSSLRMAAKRHSFDLAAQSPAAILDFYRRQDIGQFATYAETIKRWRAVYGRRLFIGLYDDICANPSLFWRDLAAHLRLVPEAAPRWHRRTGVKIFPGPDIPIPAEVNAFLTEKYRPMIGEVSDLIHRDVSGWATGRRVPPQRRSSRASNAVRFMRRQIFYARRKVFALRPIIQSERPST